MLVIAQRTEGRLDDFQRHKVRIWAHYDLDLGHFGSVDVTRWCATTRQDASR
jgi:hypothetical protein